MQTSHPPHPAYTATQKEFAREHPSLAWFDDEAAGLIAWLVFMLALATCIRVLSLCFRWICRPRRGGQVEASQYLTEARKDRLK